MSCDRIQDRLSEFVDGALPAAERAEIEEPPALVRPLPPAGARPRAAEPASAAVGP